MAMLVPVPPMTNTERQRLFRLRHPGYYRKYSARRSAMRKAAKAKVREMLARTVAEQAAAKAAAQPLALPEALPLALPAPAVREPLMLPAAPVRLCLPAPAAPGEQLPLFVMPLERPEAVLLPVTLREQRDERQARRAA